LPCMCNFLWQQEKFQLPLARWLCGLSRAGGNPRASWRKLPKLPGLFINISTPVRLRPPTLFGCTVQWQHKRYKSILQIALGYFSAVPVQPKLLRLVLFLLPAAAVLFFFTFCVGLSGECQVIKWSPKLEAIYEVQRKKSKGSYCSKTC